MRFGKPELVIGLAVLGGVACVLGIENIGPLTSILATILIFELGRQLIADRGQDAFPGCIR